MDIHTATEQAYKNGYAKGYADGKGEPISCGHEKGGEWISVEERLPQVCGVYICCVKTKGGTTWTKTAEFVPEMKMWFGKFGEIKNIVTHWMPLPEPPKGE